MRRRWVVRDAVLAVGVLVACSMSASPAGATDTPGHAITVTPSSGLSGGQVVQVSGTGFTETPIITGGWAVTECRAAILGKEMTLDNALTYCDATTQPFVYATVDGAGNLAASYAVRPTITITTLGVGTVDCTAEPCVILVSQLTSAGFVGAAAPISFGPPPPVCPGGTRPGHGHGDHKHCHQR